MIHNPVTVERFGNIAGRLAVPLCEARWVPCRPRVVLSCLMRQRTTFKKVAMVFLVSELPMRQRTDKLTRAIAGENF